MLFFSTSLSIPSKRPVASHFFASLTASDCKLCHGLADSNKCCTFDILLYFLNFYFYFMPASFWNLLTIPSVSTTGFFGDVPTALDAKLLDSLIASLGALVDTRPSDKVSYTSLTSLTVSALSKVVNTLTF